jgi:hypothetical protein
MKIVSTMMRRRIYVPTIQETKWVGWVNRRKNYIAEDLSFGTLCKVRSINGVDIIVDKEWKKDIVDVKIIGS